LSFFFIFSHSFFPPPPSKGPFFPLLFSAAFPRYRGVIEPTIAGPLFVLWPSQSVFERFMFPPMGPPPLPNLLFTTRLSRETASVLGCRFLRASQSHGVLRCQIQTPRPFPRFFLKADNNPRIMIGFGLAMAPPSFVR